MNIALIMLLFAKFQQQHNHTLMAPCLRRQIAGNFENPYDMDHPDNFDIKLFVTEYEKLYGCPPSSTVIDSVAIYPAKDNMQWVHSFMSRL